MGLCVVGPVGLIGPLSGGLVGLVVQWIWWAVGLVVGPRVWWACGSGGFCGVLTAKSPTLRGPTCQGVLGLVFYRFPGTSIRPITCQLNGPSVSRFGIFREEFAQIKWAFAWFWGGLSPCQDGLGHLCSEN